MKKFVFFGCLYIGLQWVQAQTDTKLWTRLVGSGSDDMGYAVAVDGAGNAFVAGATQGSITGAGGNAGRYDMFVAKYNSAGTQQWVKQRGTAEREFAFGVAADALGNVYTTGYTDGALDGGHDSGNFDIFVMKHDASGIWQWTRQLGFGSDDEGRAIATDRFGNIYVTGAIRGALDGLPRPGAADIFILKYDAAGNKLWSALFGSAGVDEGMGITCDTNGNVFVTGWCSETIDGTVNQGNGDNFLAKYSPNGTQLWLKQWGTINKDTGYAVAADAAGNVYVSGYTTGSLYGPPVGNRDYFVAKFDASGNALWGKEIGTSGHDEGYGATADAAGNVYVVGQTAGALGGVNQGGVDVFLSKFNPSGTALWTYQIGTSGDDQAEGVTIGSDGTVFVAGWTGGNLDGNGNLGPNDAFIMKFAPPTDVPPAPPVVLAASGVTSNAFTARWNTTSGATGYWLDVSTNSLFSNFVSGYQNLSLGNVTNKLVSGLTPTLTYFYRVRASNTHGTSGNSGTVAVTLASGSACTAILNSDFESGFAVVGLGKIASNWTIWEPVAGIVTGFDETSIVHGGAHAQRIRVGNTNVGGSYQRIPATASKTYTISVWIYAGDNLSPCFLGVDPTGGTNGNSGNVVWSSATTNVAWVQKTWTGTASANLITVFYKVATADNTKRNGYFDDATPSSALSPLLVQRDTEAVTLTWPECPAAHLEHALNLLEPISWETATNQVNVSGGQKAVTMMPTEGTGFFRLVLE